MKTNTSRRKFLKTLSVLSVAPAILYHGSFSKKQTIPRIGYLSGLGVLHLETFFKDELLKLGFKNGENIQIEERLARPNTSDGFEMAKELAKMDLSLIVVGSLSFAREVQKHNAKMPMIIVNCPGMVSNGFAKTLEHPEGIYTGIDVLADGVTTKRLQLLKAAVPGITHVALLSTTDGVGGHEFQLLEAEKAAATLGIKVKAYRASSLEQLEKALNDLVNDGMNGMLLFQGSLVVANRKLMVDFAANKQLPTIYTQQVFAELGGLMAWAPELEQQFREAAHYVEKILKGAKPGDLPVKHPEKYYLTLNAATAKMLGIQFSKELLAEASKIIE